MKASGHLCVHPARSVGALLGPKPEVSQKEASAVWREVTVRPLGVTPSGNRGGWAGFTAAPPQEMFDDVSEGPGESRAGLPRLTLQRTTRRPHTCSFKASAGHTCSHAVLARLFRQLSYLHCLLCLSRVLSGCFHYGCVDDPTSGRHRQRFRSPQ